MTYCRACKKYHDDREFYVYRGEERVRLAQCRESIARESRKEHIRYKKRKRLWYGDRK